MLMRDLMLTLHGHLIAVRPITRVNYEPLCPCTPRAMAMASISVTASLYDVLLH